MDKIILVRSSMDKIILVRSSMDKIILVRSSMDKNYKKYCSFFTKHAALGS
jgi:hypothetical protein